MDATEEAAYIWLNPLASLLHGQTMVDHMFDHSGLNLVRDNGSPSCSFCYYSSSYSSSPSHASPSSRCFRSRVFLITSNVYVANKCARSLERTCGDRIGIGDC